MGINVLLFGSLTEITGESSIRITSEMASDVQLLHSYLLEKYPSLATKTFQYAVNQELVDKAHALQDGDEVALLPPFSGG